ncbi:MAG: hypothetical protein AUJ98_04135 [Bacteroidetes bacterium CG2_30_33_31]|nr:MAG: hypothetical protein AUJ98_04135 [Bacteroidetes bacterium CG2_30_33_31]
MKKVFLFIYLTAFALGATAQTIPVHLSEINLYDFIDELANEQLIDINSAVKPYSKMQVYEWLIASKASKNLSKRQQNQIDFYLHEYKMQSDDSLSHCLRQNLNLINKWSKTSSLQLDQLGYYYKDKNFTFALKPIWGIDYRTNDSGAVRHFWGGLGAYANIGKHWAFYASLRDNSITEIMSYPSTFTQEDAGNYKIGEGGRPGGDYSEMRGGITYSWQWGDFGLIKDHVSVGDNYHGANILSGRSPSYAMLKLHLNPVKWFDFNYHHGWLVSEDVDSSRSYWSTAGTYKEVFRPKFIATNLFTFIPFRGINFSIGNSIIYTDLGGPHPAYFIPVMFFKSIDHTLNHNIENQNSQMFANLSIRKIKHLHLYSSLYIDEFKTDRITNDTLHNFVSIKSGFKLSNWPVKNLSMVFEFTRTTPMTYKHTVAGLTYASNKFNLGHYLIDNSQETYLALQWKPIAKLYLKGEYFYAKHGDDFQYNYTLGYDVTSIPVVKNLTWSNHTFGLFATYEILNDVYINAYFTKTNIQGFDLNGFTARQYLDRFTSPFYQGNQNTLGFGLNIGF